ncbi:lysoplasmalogenase [Actinacidiphila alni]|uniref:lysoplasmalogenase n=1 Tax=Actinacidiphila alni TaxID=380248 RepID=UPI003F50B353
MRTPGAGTGARSRDAFCALAVLHLAAIALDQHLVQLATKPLLMPALAAWAAARGAPRTLLAALMCGCAGDVLLEIGGTVPFLLGMAGFAAGHICYLRLFAALRGGGRPAFGPQHAVYAVVWAVMVALLWPGLDAGLRVPVAAYSLLLTAMAAAAYGLGPVTALGGAFFLLSDTLIATGLADWPELPGHGFWIMATYLAAQSLLAAGAPRAVAGDPAYRGAAPITPS